MHIDYTFHSLRKNIAKFLHLPLRETDHYENGNHTSGNIYHPHFRDNDYSAQVYEPDWVIRLRSSPYYREELLNSVAAEFYEAQFAPNNAATIIDPNPYEGVQIHDPMNPSPINNEENIHYIHLSSDQTRNHNEMQENLNGNINTNDNNEINNDVNNNLTLDSNNNRQNVQNQIISVATLLNMEKGRLKRKMNRAFITEENDIKTTSNDVPLCDFVGDKWQQLSLELFLLSGNLHKSLKKQREKVFTMKFWNFELLFLLLHTPSNNEIFNSLGDFKSIFIDNSFIPSQPLNTILQDGLANHLMYETLVKQGNAGENLRFFQGYKFKMHRREKMPTPFIFTGYYCLTNTKDFYTNNTNVINKTPIFSLFDPAQFFYNFNNVMDIIENYSFYSLHLTFGVTKLRNYKGPRFTITQCTLDDMSSHPWMRVQMSCVFPPHDPLLSYLPMMLNKVYRYLATPSSQIGDNFNDFGFETIANALLKTYNPLENINKYLKTEPWGQDSLAVVDDGIKVFKPHNPKIDPKYFTKISHETDTCPICLMNFQTNDICITLNCSHVFHKRCAETWLIHTSSNLNKCPICRR